MDKADWRGKPDEGGLCEFCGAAAGAAVEIMSHRGIGTARYVHACKDRECIAKAHRLAGSTRIEATGYGHD